MKNITRITATFLSAAFLAAGGRSFEAGAVFPLMIGDINRDDRVSMSDIVILKNSLRGKYGLNDTQRLAADANQDGEVDALDIPALQDIIIHSRNRLPVGTWIGDRNGAKRYFCFGSGFGYVVMPDGKDHEFTLEINDDILVLKINKSNKDMTAFITWTGADSFVLKWEDGTAEYLRSCSEYCLEAQNMLNGNWITDCGRTFNIEGLSGKLTDKNGGISRFEYFPSGSDSVFHFGTTENKTECTIRKIDSMHYMITWADGTTEKLTRREIEVRNGITYVNGVLIANKSYSLPSNYAPGKILPDAQAAFDAMAADAKKQGISLSIVSGFRSYDYQSTLYNNYVARDGKAAADTYSARPGYSEHQTGLAMDINNASTSFNNTMEAKWIADNCVKYGFIIRYPKGKENITGYQYESWHVRYLGKELAKEVADSGLTLEEFLCIDSKYKS
jgi:hypothetical protein